MRREQKGGLLLPYKKTEESANIFRNFINNSDITFLNRGSQGIVLKATLQSPIPQNYLQICPDDNYGRPVDTILIKVCAISAFDMKFQVDNKGSIMHSTKMDEFQNEINIQTDIYLKTVEYLQPLCPAIVYADILPSFTEIVNLLIIKISSIPLRYQLNALKNGNVEFGLIGMEFMKDGKPLHNTEMNETQLNVCRFSLLELAIKTGYNHNDFHKGNIMIEKNNNYFAGLSMRAVLIDFGRAAKIPPDVLQEIKENVANKQYINAFKLLCSFKSSYSLIHNPKYNSYYGWVCGDYNTNDPVYLDEFSKSIQKEHGGVLENIKEYLTTAHKTNLCALSDGEIDMLYTLREQAIDINVQTMNALHETDAKFPLLPVSNTIKNSLYNGMIGGKKHKKSRRRRTRKNKKTLKTKSRY
jgi:hypothetical protein